MMRICDTDFAFNMFSAKRTEAVRLFKEFNLAENKDMCLDYNQAVRLNDAEATDVIKSISGIGNTRGRFETTEKVPPKHTKTQKAYPTYGII